MMLRKFDVVISNEAKNDFRKLLEWYKAVNGHLPSRLKADFEQLIDRLRLHPFAHAVRFSDVRLALCGVFPVTIHYYIDEDRATVLIIGVYHEASNPEDWRPYTKTG